jgi:hypothetical protein
LKTIYPVSVLPKKSEKSIKPVLRHFPHSSLAVDKLQMPLMGKLQSAAMLLEAWGSHLHKECPEKGNTTSALKCYKCELTGIEKAHSPNYRNWRHAKEEIRKKRKFYRATKTTTRNVFSTNLVTPGLSFAATIRKNTEQGQRPQPRQVSVAVAGPATVEPKVAALCIPTAEMFRVVSVVE